MRTTRLSISAGCVATRMFMRKNLSEFLVGGAEFASVAARVRTVRIEWITVGLFVGCYSLWAGAIALSDVVGFWLAAPAAAFAAALHASLQHEAAHGHPTRSAAWNEALAFPALSLLFPYRRFRETHLKHHADARLTDPYDDPESWYVAEGPHAALSAPMQRLLMFNNTLAGRLVVGPWLSAVGLWRQDIMDLRGPRRGRILGAYARHALGVGVVWAWVASVSSITPLAYLLCVAWPAVALLMLRSFAEHRAAENAEHRTIIVEAEPIFALLFLNNNLHAVHHAHPAAPWYALPAMWRRDRAAVLARNGGYWAPGYVAIARRWLWRAKEPTVHPLMRRRPRSGNAEGS